MENSLTTINEQFYPVDLDDLVTDEDYDSLMETCMHLIVEYVTKNPKAIADPDFDSNLEQNLIELLLISFEHIQVKFPYLTSQIEEEIEALVIFCKEASYNCCSILPRSYSTSFVKEPPNILFINTQIEYLKSKPQPVQRTPEWYTTRHNLITASNASKTLDSQSSINQLIYEKCLPLTVTEEQNNVVKMVNIHSPMHWGQKYEPLTVALYETIYKTKIDDFGCIKHDVYPFLGASPDGINVDPHSLRFGRMLEIKNVFSRNIDGIPKFEYWVQMQLQMETCNLDSCDFVETKMTEYENSDEFYDDLTPNVDVGDNDELIDIPYKGVIMYFHTKEGKPFYKYMPLYYLMRKEIEYWLDSTLEIYENEPYNYTWMKDYYWRLDIFSCVLVLRNKQWFQDNIQQIQNVWNAIERERITGYQHRAPSKRTKKENVNTEIQETNTISNKSNGCFMNIVKLNN
jgi:putative phage-type endonuclease